MLKTKMLALPAAVLLALASSCSTFTPPAERPVIEEKLNRGFIDDSSAVGTLVLQPDRRVVLANFANGRFCAEAPTEVGSDISRLVSANASGKSSSEVQAALGLVLATTLTNAVLNKRTQGMQYLQTNGYFLCQMYMNDAISKDQLVVMQTESLKQAARLIEVEIPLLYKADTPTKTAAAALDVNKMAKDAMAAQAGAKADDVKKDDVKK